MRWSFLFRYVFVNIMFQASTEATPNDPPTWDSPAQINPVISLDITAPNACDKVTKLRASSGDGSTVIISLVPQSPDGGFTIDEDVFGNKLLKCDKNSITEPSYKVVLKAKHDGGNNAETILTLTISVKGLTEPVAPVFIRPDPDDTKKEHKIFIPETIQEENEVLTLEATDEDTDNAALTFNMDESPISTKELFEIDTRTNKLMVKSGVAKDYFDAEKKDAILEYPIILEVSDGALSARLSTTIYVTDVNDNRPEFSGNFTAEIPETAVAGYSVLNVTVSDNDRTKANNQVKCTLSGAAEFEIIGEEILVAAGASFDARLNSSFRLTVTASDNAPTDPKSTDKDIIISITAGQRTSEKGESNSGNNNRGLIIAVVLALCVSVSVPASAGLASYKGLSKSTQWK
ncbi:cadherin-4-like isoform X2 [Mercenaria mercenaria]|uniref:cadherin-4-like isoform X2 n=1 Tax=Mercenaria mercenaria TaxID=6596 RepID=UPI00234F9ACE|nr:cadherin-4-like isoform X2 [Mercenaria mercenaria]